MAQIKHKKVGRAQLGQNFILDRRANDCSDPAPSAPEPGDVWATHGHNLKARREAQGAFFPYPKESFLENHHVIAFNESDEGRLRYFNGETPIDIPNNDT
jgi:hypothetical protein